jgi:hypothetical protein
VQNNPLAKNADALAIAIWHHPVLLNVYVARAINLNSLLWRDQIDGDYRKRHLASFVATAMHKEDSGNNP